MAQSLFFSRRQRSMVGEALHQAEHLAGEFFGVDLRNPARFPYDLETLINLQGLEVTHRALAQVCLYEYRRRVSPAKQAFYRICLQDHKILDAVRKEGQRKLPPLLLYVIAHELIHVIRFSLDPGRFHLRPEEKRIEEREVHRLTYDLLRRNKDSRLELILDRFRPCRTSVCLSENLDWGGEGAYL